MGLGRHFKADFFQNGWNEILYPNYFTDSNVTDEMRELLGDKCIELDEALKNKEALFVIYIKDSKDIEDILNKHGLDYVTMQEIYMC